MKAYCTRDRETGTIIEEFDTLEGALAAIEAYEKEDKHDGTYEADFYEVGENKDDGYETYESKRRTTTSAAVKNRYNAKVYDRINVALPKETVKRFKDKCKADGIPYTQIIKAAIDEYIAE